MKMSREEYRKFSESQVPRSPVFKNAVHAFLTGGLICTLGQLILNIYLSFGLEQEAAASAESLTLIFMGVLLTALGVYDKLAKFAGAGSLVPISGFANSVAAPALEFRSEGFITGTAARMFIISGPVIVFGISGSVVYGFLYWLSLRL